MHIHQPASHFQFFGNREVTSLYFTLALVQFAVGLVSVFVPIYLWQIGYPLWQVLLFFFLESLYFVPLSFIMLPIFRRLTDKSMLLLSLPFFILYFVGLSYVESFPVLFYLIPAIFGIKNLLFNTGYHLNFSSAADDKNLGKELGLRHMISSLFSLTAPFLGGLLIGMSGFQSAFFATSVMLLVAVLPLLFFPKRHVSPTLSAKSVWSSVTDKRLKFNTLSNIGYANEFIVGGVVWKLFLFLAIGSIEKFGGVISAALFASSIVTFLAGVMSDDGRRNKLIAGTSGLLSGLWASRILVKSVVGATVSHVALHLVYPALIVAWSRQFYHLAKTSSNPTEFILGREVSLHISRTLFIGLLILIAILFSQPMFFSITFILAAVFSLFFLFSNKQDMTVFEK